LARGTVAEASQVEGQPLIAASSAAMDKAEARELQADKIAVLRQMPYQELHAWAERGKVETESVLAQSGRDYQLEVQALWDDRKRGHVRVMVSVDEGGRRAFMPLTDDFIMAPDGSFVGE
jgi:hypothetical protein